MSVHLIFHPGLGRTSGDHALNVEKVFAIQTR
jgi:hypothetical protein